MARHEAEQRHVDLFGEQKMLEAKTRGRLAVQIKQARKAEGWTQQALAEQMGMSVSTIRRIESGSTMPSISTLMTVSQVLSITFIIGESSKYRSPFPNA
ncbi:multiprotein-bridging factor 1 family protein [Marinococcus halophilus]|uniref:HTH cro/C1-type domain-containing protein n=2 Tax=Marinococcus halophilus TaxID=1371 RepID=A0A510Y968_MARHA|nr:hypothetical protein MHA01_28000 [Marinococcus halophilus]